MSGVQGEGEAAIYYTGGCQIQSPRKRALYTVLSCIALIVT